MSTAKQIKRITVPQISAHKGKPEALVGLTAYTAPMAAMLDPHVDFLLVGDSLGMVIYGMDSTLPVTLEMMIAHGQAVMRGSKRACVVVDMPFGSYQESKEQAYRNAARVMKETGCSAVKMEGGQEMAETIQYLAERSIPVMAHIGLQPQSVNSYGGYGARGKTDTQEQKIRDDAKAVAAAGAFAVVVEGVVEDLGATITRQTNIPTIGIGASAACDGQILVTEDMLGLTVGHKPKFVKPYAALSENIGDAVAEYAREVRSRSFPDAPYTYGRPAEIPSEIKDKKVS